MKKEIYLASASKSRRELVQKFGLDWKCVDNEFDEDSAKYEIHNFDSACNYTKFLSKGKALSVANKYDGIIIGCDSIVYQKGGILEKPKNENEFNEMMKLITAYPHQLITGVSIFDTKLQTLIQFTDITKLFFTPFTDEQKNTLLHKYNGFSNAGGYTLCEEIADNTHIIKGTKENVIGLPIKHIIEEIKGLL